MVNRSSISRFVLEKLSEAGGLALDALFPRNRAEGRLWRKVLGLPDGYEFSKPTFSVILNRLKKQGLVVRVGGKRYAVWRVTAKGKSKVNHHRMEPAQRDGIPRLVVYDIPELERKKRDWLRYALIACGYEQLQRSVWLGYCPLPEEFIQFVKDMSIRKSVHIVSIHKTGTLADF